MNLANLLASSFVRDVDKRIVAISSGGAGSGRHKEGSPLKREFKKTMSQAQQLKHATLKGRGWKDLGDDKNGNLLLERPDSLGGGKYSVDKDAILKRIEAGGPGSGRHKERLEIEHEQLMNKLNEHLNSSQVKNYAALAQAHEHLSKAKDRLDKDNISSANIHIGRAKAILIDNKFIHAGGPGSGRHPWGRKEKEHVNLKELSHKERVEYLKKYIPEHTQVGDKPKVTKPTLAPAEKIYPHSGKGSMGVGKHPDVKHEERLGKITGPAGKPAVGLERKNAPAPLYKKAFSKEEEEKEKAGQAEMRNWQQQHPVASQKTTSINPGDEVKTLKTTKAFDNDKLEFKQYKPGTTLTVINVLPKVGNNPQLMVAQYPGRQGDMVHMPVTDVRLHKTLEGIQEKPAYKIREEIGLTKGIRPGKITQQIETPTGATYTKLKPEIAGRPQGSGNIKKSENSDEHSLKGKFSTAIGPKGNRLKEVFTFDTNLKSFGQGTARATVWDASKTPRTPDQIKNGTEGTTVIAWRDTKNKTGKVMEFDKDANGYIKQGSKPMQSFNNLGKMGGYLKQRYGISMKLPGESVARKGRKK